MLLRGLSPGSATVAALTSRTEFGRKREDVVEVTTPEQAQRTFEALFKPA